MTTYSSYIQIGFEGCGKKIVYPNMKTSYMGGKYGIFFTEKGGVANVVVTTVKASTNYNDKIKEVTKRLEDIKNLTNDIANSSNELTCADLGEHCMLIRKHHNECSTRILKDGKLQISQYKETMRDPFELLPNVESRVTLSDSSVLVCVYHPITGIAILNPVAEKEIITTDFQMELSICEDCLKEHSETVVSLFRQSTNYICHLCSHNTEGGSATDYDTYIDV